MKITCTALVLLFQALPCLASDDLPFQLTNKDTGFCLVKTNNNCNGIRWTTDDRLLVPLRKRCLAAQGKTVGSEINLGECDEKSDLQKWECKNGTLLALKDQELYIELTADSTAVLSKTVGPNNHLTISGTSSGACLRTYRELFAIGGNAAGLPCMFPFQYQDQWYTDCTTVDSPEKRLWCAVETKYQSERWGYCPRTSKEGWTIHPTTGAYYQLNTQSALMWSQAEASCKQQGASLLSITDPHQQAYVTALLGTSGSKMWTGLILDPEHSWMWSNGRPFSYMKWDSGHPLPSPGHSCGIVDPAVQYSWQSSPCSKKLGYICYSKAAEILPAQGVTGFCSRPWIFYNGHCFHLNRTQQTWTDAQRECDNERGNLVSIRNVEDQSFVISQLGYESTDELWIGLNDRKTEGLFDWSDHSTVSFTSWEYVNPAPSSYINDCVLIRGENGNWADRLCEERHGSICMKKSSSKPTGDEVQQDAGCKTGWKRHGSYCYFIGMQTKTFDEAKDECKSSDSYLADVSNRVDNAFLVSLVGLRSEKYFWIGLSNQENIDQFMWTNRGSVKFTHWNAEMPGRSQGCVAMATGYSAGLWDVLPCINKQKYICKHLAEGAVLTPATPTAAPSRCADDWNRIGLRNYCYKLFKSSEKMTWFEARDYCRAIGGDLLSIHSADEQQALPPRSAIAWIGLSAPDSVTGYVWSDGSPLQFQHWEDGEPNNKNNVESCASVNTDKRSESGSWNDLHCETYLNWLCQIPAGVTPDPPPDPVTPDYNTTGDGWLEWNGAQYFLFRLPMAMEDARSFCQRKHADLVTIDSEAESVFLWKQMQLYSSSSYWIGLNVDLDKTYSWMDGSSVVFQRWDEDQPLFKRNDENCAVITRSMGFWHVYNCGDEHMSICKRSATPSANATVAPTVPPKGGCPQNWKQYESKCYNIVNDQKETWHGAKAQCQEIGGNLASIMSRQVQVFLTAQLAEAPATNLWIGMYNVRGGSFLWTDGRPKRYYNWGSTLQRLQNIHRVFSHMHPHSYHHSDFFRRYHSLSHAEQECAVMTTDHTIGIGKWIKTSCNDTNGYVCLRNVDPSLPDSSQPTPVDYVNVFNDSFKLVPQKMTWDAAKKNCERDGAQLASPRNQWSQNFVEFLALQVKGAVWIGLNKLETGGYFRFIGGWRITATYWGRMEPSPHLPCVYVAEDGKWNTGYCNRTESSICMKTKDVAPTESSDFPGFCPDNLEAPSYSQRTGGWLPFKGYCYLTCTEEIEWPDASASCIKHGGNLASIEDPSEQEFIQNTIKQFKDSHTSFWIGLYKTHAGIWRWLDRAAMDYTNWSQGQNMRNSYGSILASDGGWTTGAGYHDRGYICKTAKTLRQAPQTTANPTGPPESRRRNILAVALVLAGIAAGTVVALVLFKKSGRRLAIPERLSTFDNPLFFNNERVGADSVDTSKLVANAEEENPPGPGLMGTPTHSV
ncbi:uncharacterized protein ACO6RY_13810 [Pungitius sinensis]